MMPLESLDADRLRSGITWFNPHAGPLFERALWRGRLRRQMAKLLRRSWRLLHFGDAVSPDRISSAPPTTPQIVELDAIRGSINRCEEFDSRFYPVTDRVQDRWVRIASMTLQNTALPPVDLIRVGSIYFVVDGHHRISVSRMLDYATVDAVITAAYD
ncbi:MAG: hypothetical protein U0521_15570 [Anaerolineae bacterium]